ncbi:MAG: fused MFS/spermidine synthase [Rhodocyclaceae bacterium]|nr:fused MFS/spermidine synthase [Rhodocyclaceae bacterium]
MNDTPPQHPIDVSEDAGVRYLHFGSEWIQGAMRIRRPWALELAYTREMLAGLLLHEAPWPRKVLLIGLGAGSLTKFLWRYFPQAQLTVVEINPRMPLAARQFFKLPEEDERLQIHIDDGARFVMHDRQRYDLILVDGFDHYARAGVLDSEAFYVNVRARLSRAGVMTTNLFGHTRGFRASVARIAKCFDGRSLVFPSLDSGNAIALAVEGSKLAVSLDELRSRAKTLKAATGLDLAPTITRLQLAKSLPENTLTL